MSLGVKADVSVGNSNCRWLTALLFKAIRKLANAMGRVT